MRARFLLREVDERRGDRDLELMSVSMTRGVVPRSDLTDDEPRADDLSNYKVCRAGDIVVNRMSAYQGALGLAQQDGIVSPDYIVFRLSDEVAPRFLHHVMRSSWFVSEMAARIRGIGSIGTGNVRTPRVSAEEIGEIRIAVPDRGRQQAIADYLDTETARIDALITKKQRMIELLVERQAVGLDWVLGPAESGTRLKHCADLLPGYAFSSEEFSTESSGPRLLRGINVNPESVVWDEAVRLDALGSAPTRYRLKDGDVVVGMDRPFVASGTRVAVIDADSEGSYLVQRVCRIRTSSRAAAVLVAAALRSPRFRAYVEADLSGVSVPHLSDTQIGMFIVPEAVAAGDVSKADQITKMTDSHRLLAALVGSQIDLLREHRQALITAAVTGELEVPGVAL